MHVHCKARWFFLIGTSPRPEPESLIGLSLCHHASSIAYAEKKTSKISDCPKVNFWILLRSPINYSSEWIRTPSSKHHHNFTTTSAQHHWGSIFRFIQVADMWCSSWLPYWPMSMKTSFSKLVSKISNKYQQEHKIQSCNQAVPCALPDIIWKQASAMMDELWQFWSSVSFSLPRPSIQLNLPEVLPPTSFFLANQNLLNSASFAVEKAWHRVASHFVFEGKFGGKDQWALRPGWAVMPCRVCNVFLVCRCWGHLPSWHIDKVWFLMLWSLLSMKLPLAFLRANGKNASKKLASRATCICPNDVVLFTGLCRERTVQATVKLHINTKR